MAAVVLLLSRPVSHPHAARAAQTMSTTTLLTKQIHKIFFAIAVLTTTLSFQSQTNNFCFVQASSTAHSIPTSSNTRATTTTTSMTSTECKSLSFLDDLRRKYQHQPTFLQAVEEMALSLTDLFQDAKDGEFHQRAFLMTAEPERIIAFRVPWMDDTGRLRFNRGWRVEFSR